MINNGTGWDDTIVALATAPGIGAIGVIRLSGANALLIADKIFPSKKISEQKSHTLHVGFIKDGNKDIDEVVVSVFKDKKSYTGENVIELSCHGSPYVQQQILDICIKNGARLAKPGEFTQRAYLNGKLDLIQAEAVADIIASENEAVHTTALQQMKGGFSNDIKNLRQQLIDFAALIELELDFSEEDVEFADRTKLKNLTQEILQKVQILAESFKYGNIIKNGVVTVIAGRPNAGKSTLLNAMLNEERAIVTHIAGTTRDTIEERLIIDGIDFRLVDTAGIREATDVIEKIGIEKSIEKINIASILIYVFDASTSSELEVVEDITKLATGNQQIILVANKIDKCEDAAIGMLNWSIKELAKNDYPIFEIAAVNKTKINDLKEYLPALVKISKTSANQTIVVNARHYAALKECEECIIRVQQSLNNKTSSDLLAMDLRYALHALGSITGQISNEDVLGSIFSKFCIGK